MNLQNTIIDLKNMRIKTKLLLYIVASVAILMALTTYVTVNNVMEQEISAAHEEAESVSKQYAYKYDSDMRSNLLMAQTLGNTMEKYESSDREEINSILKNMLEEEQDVLGIYVGYEPNAFDGKDSEYANTQGHDSTGRFIPYWSRMSGSVGLDALAGYETDEYYQVPKSTEDDVILEPFVYDGVMMVSYLSPIMKEGEFAGIAGVDVSLNYIDEEVSQVSIFDTGYAFMVSNSGILMSHPTEKEWVGTKSLNEFERPEIKQMAADIKNGVGGNRETIDPTTGKEVYMAYQPVETADFSFILTIPKEEMLAGAMQLRNELILISMIAILAMAGVAFLIARSITKPIENIVDDFKQIASEALDGKLDRKAETNIGIDF